MNKQNNQKKRKACYSVVGAYYVSTIHINEYILAYVL